MPYSYNPVVISRELGLDNRLLSGGKIYTYQYGTTTPKATFATFDGSVVNSNPTILDASGHANIFLDVGAYKMVVTDQHGVQVSVIDGIVGVALSAAASEPIDLGTSVVVDTYSDVRALQGTYDTVYVCGRATPGDGGAGWLRLDPLATYIDDNAVTLVSTNGNHYTRDNITQLDPRWFGVQYGSGTDQATMFNDACNASIKYKVPVVVEDKIYITSNFNVLAGVSVRLVSSGAFTSAVVATITFNPGSMFEGRPMAFLDALQPIFITSQAVYLSWMGAQTAEAKTAKAIAACSSYNTILYIDRSLILSMNLVVPANVTLTQYGNNITSFPTTSNLTISVPNIVINGSNQFFDINTTTADVDLGDRFALPEWFGAIGDGTTDDSIPLKACFSHGKALLNAPAYFMSYNHNQSKELIIKSDTGSNLKINNGWQATTLNLDNLLITSTQDNQIQCQSLITNNTTIGNNIKLVLHDIWAVNSAMAITGATITGDTHLAGVGDNSADVYRSIYNNKPKLVNSWLAGDTIIDGQIAGYPLTVDNGAKIVPSYDTVTRSSIETIPRGTMDTIIEYVISTPPAGGRTIMFIPINIPVSTIFKTSDLFTSFIKFYDGVFSTVSFGIATVVGINGTIRLATTPAALTTNWVNTAVIPNGQSVRLYPHENAFAYVSIVSTAQSNIRYKSSASGFVTDIFPYAAHYQSSTDTSHPGYEDYINFTQLTTSVGTPYISLKPGA